MSVLRRSFSAGAGACVLLVSLMVGVHVCQASLLVARHQLVQVETGGESVIRLTHYDDTSAASVSPTELKFTIKSLPADGDLYQLSNVYSKYGYEPKLGSKIVTVGAVVTGSDHRLVYRRRSPDAAALSAWATFTFDVHNGETTSLEATVTLVPPSGVLTGSDFLLGNEGWTVVGNKAVSSAASFESLSRGPALNHYILSHDDKIDVTGAGEQEMDHSMWYFDAPSKFTGDKGIAYGGAIEFTVGAFSGDFGGGVGGDAAAVRITCDDCEGPVGPGITLVFPVSALTAFLGDVTRMSVPLLEGEGWLKDPQNTLSKWIPASQCDIIQVLYRMSSLQLLGDWTTRHESVAIDDVSLLVAAGSSPAAHHAVPLCAQQDTPDASICSCA